MQSLIILTPEQLEELIKKTVNTELTKFLEQLQGTKHQLMTASEVAKLYGVSRVTVYQMKKDGRLPFIYVGSRVRFPRKAVVERLEQTS